MRRTGWIGLGVFACLLTLLGSARQETAAALPDARSYGAIGDGVADDTVALRSAVERTNDGRILIPRGTFRITGTIEIDLARRGPIVLEGPGRVVMAGPGPAFRLLGTHTGSAHPSSVKPGIWERERMPRIEGIEIVGDHPEADGIELVRTFQPTLSRVLIHNVRHAVHVVDRGRNLLVDSCHLYDNRGVGVFLDHVNIHQAIIHGSHISYCKGGGIKIHDGEVRNVQIAGNDIEYNYDLNAPASADVWIEVESGSIREGAITGNTIQAKISPGGANVRFVGPADVNKVSMFTISGNHISNQEVNVHLKNCRGIVLEGNSVALSGRRNLLVENGLHVVVGPHSFDHNPDYKDPVVDGITLRNCDGCSLQGILLEGSKAGADGSGGAIELFDCRNTLVLGCQVFEAVGRSLFVQGGTNLRIADCLIADRRPDAQGQGRVAVETVGTGANVVLDGNQVDASAGTVLRKTPETQQHP